MRAMLWASIAAVSLVACDRPKDGAAPTSPAARTLHVFTWTGYLDDDTVAGFESEAGCKVAQDFFDNNEALRAKLLAGNSGYDVVCPSDYMVPLLVEDGLLAEIDLAKVPGAKDFLPRYREPAYDPAPRHAVPYRWGVTGIAFRKSEVKDPPRTWKDVFDETKLAAWKGRISMLDDGRELAVAALLALGKDPKVHDDASLAAARELLVRQKPFVAKYDSNNFGASLVAKETVIAQGWSGDVANAQVEDPDIGFLVPEEGALQYTDNWAIPKDAPSKDLALQFIAYLSRPDVATAATVRRRYASVSAAAYEKLPAEIRGGAAYEDGHGRPMHLLSSVTGPDARALAAAHSRLYADVKSH
jgi:spermidine/putrescine transport system substrate-binding protein